MWSKKRTRARTNWLSHYPELRAVWMLGGYMQPKHSLPHWIIKYKTAAPALLSENEFKGAPPSERTHQHKWHFSLPFDASTHCVYLSSAHFFSQKSRAAYLHFFFLLTLVNGFIQINDAKSSRNITDGNLILSWDIRLNLDCCTGKLLRLHSTYTNWESWVL